MRRGIEDTTYLIGGAIAGAVAMYLLDPEAGERRRGQLKNMAGDATHGAGAQLGAAWGAVESKLSDLRHSDAVSGIGERLSSIGDRIAHGVGDARSSLADAGSSAASSARDAGRRAANYAGDSRDSLIDMARSAWDKTRSRFGPEPEPSHAVAYTSAGLSVLAAGAAAMYFFDPHRGSHRRGRIVDQSQDLIAQTGRMCRALGVQFNTLLRHGPSSQPAQQQNAPQNEATAADELLRNVRRTLNEVNPHANRVQVMTDNHGVVTLHGRAMGTDAEKTILAIREIPGVHQVVNLMTICNTEHDLSEGNGMSMPSPASSLTL